MQVKIGYSPCPNDTFIFGAMVNGMIDTHGIRFEPVLRDVEALNTMASSAELPITKISFNAFLPLTDRYRLLNSGAALGRDCGPLLIAQHPYSNEDLADLQIAIPGEQTTANFLLDYFFSHNVRKQVMMFNEIEEAILSGRVNAGVIIHENRFTFADKGLHLIQDLGSHWEEKTGQPIPLGGIVADRTFDQDIVRKVEVLIQESIDFARRNPSAVMPYIREHAQEMEDSVMMQHIALYVNDFTRSLGKVGRLAIEHFFDQGVGLGRIDAYQQIFLDP